jgi:hypothetical protein
MANDRWRSDQDRDRYRDEGYGRGRDRGEWDREQRQGVSGERDFASRDFREPERGFYSGSAEERRGYQGYGPEVAGSVAGSVMNDEATSEANGASEARVLPT